MSLNLSDDSGLSALALLTRLAQRGEKGPDLLAQALTGRRCASRVRVLRAEEA